MLKEEKFSYVVIGEEVGESGTHHLQGYAEFTKPAKWAPLAKKFKMHCEVARGTALQAIEYCKKDGIFVERGESRGDGGAIGGKIGGEMEKQRWRGIIRMAEEGKLEELKEVEPEVYVRCFTTLNKIKQSHMAALPELEHLENMWIWGEPGVGKSRMAREKAGGVFYPKALNKWWDGYLGEDWVIIDDYEKDCHLDHYIKIWGDRYDFIGETKGGSLRIRPKHIIVTSNYSIDEVFQEETLREAVKRRFKGIRVRNLA